MRRRTSQRRARSLTVQRRARSLRTRSIAFFTSCGSGWRGFASISVSDNTSPAPVSSFGSAPTRCFLGANWIAAAQLGWSRCGTGGEAVGANARGARELGANRIERTQVGWRSIALDERPCDLPDPRRKDHSISCMLIQRITPAIKVCTHKIENGDSYLIDALVYFWGGRLLRCDFAVPRTS
jgi:hypothetical protein